MNTSFRVGRRIVVPRSDAPDWRAASTNRGPSPLVTGLVRVSPILIGDAAQDFAAALEGRAPYTVAGDLATALSAASARAAADGADAPVVLLSPACASFDQFSDFEARGDAFRALVTALPGRRTARRTAHRTAKGGALD